MDEILSHEGLIRSGPREKLIKYGPQTLSVPELIAILLRTGTQECSVVKLSEKLYRDFNSSLYEFQCASFESLNKVKGIGEVKSVTIKAALELGIRFYNELSKQQKQVKIPSDLFRLCRDMSFLDVEFVRLVCLDSKSKVINVEDITKGISNASLIHPREIFRSAITHSAVSIAVVHNHPSGDPTPSKQDIAITKKITQSGEIIGIKMIDHVIIGKGKFYSFALQREIDGMETQDGDMSGRQSRIGKIAENESGR